MIQISFLLLGMFGKYSEIYLFILSLSLNIRCKDFFIFSFLKRNILQFIIIVLFIFFYRLNRSSSFVILDYFQSCYALQTRNEQKSLEYKIIIIDIDDRKKEKNRRFYINHISCLLFNVHEMFYKHFSLVVFFSIKFIVLTIQFIEFFSFRNKIMYIYICFLIVDIINLCMFPFSVEYNKITTFIFYFIIRLI